MFIQCNVQCVQCTPFPPVVGQLSASIALHSLTLPAPGGESREGGCVPSPWSTLAGERGDGRVPIPTRGQTLWYSILYIYKYFVVEGEACWWTVHPASKQRSEGEKVRVGDDVIFVSVATERYLVSCRTWTY
jgi:hypothetical protein